MKKVLVTGGAGFVGFNLCKQLIKKDYEITVLATSENGKVQKYTNTKEDRYLK